MAKLTIAMLKSMIDGIEASSGKKPDTVVCGSDYVAEQVREMLAELELDFHVITDDELSPSRVWVTSQEALAEFPGGCRN